MDFIFLLNGVLLPLAAVYFLPTTVKASGWFSCQTVAWFCLVLMVSALAHFDKGLKNCIFLSVCNLMLVAVGAYIYLYFSKYRSRETKHW